MSECTHDCSTCSSKCSEAQKTDFIEKLNDLSSVKKVIGIVSGKGGVGKSLVTSMLSVIMNRRGYQSAILDADITGPSIPKMFGLSGQAVGNDTGILPMKTKTGINVISSNLLLEDSSSPIIWRGPVIANLVKQFWTDVIWHKIDFMFVDMPPGTGDVPLTVFQSMPIDGIVIVTSPQELVSMIVTKAVKMAEMMNIPIIGIVENMSYVICPDCGKEFKVFGESHVEEIASEHGIEVIGKLPMVPDLAKLCDSGLLELFEGNWMENAADKVEELIK
ncbi:MAG: Mrp/NBP35 family ATP-binding protein [Clostridiales bacterium]|nr:Mrp/NBP35 family ATP-binding protein [Clostridiales bacterium]